MSIEKREYVKITKEKVVYYVYTEDDWGWAFAYTPGDEYINEFGDGRMRWSPIYPKGWMESNGQHISIKSYARFGSDSCRADEIADYWRECAKKAWDEFVAQGIIEE